MQALILYYFVLRFHFLYKIFPNLLEKMVTSICITISLYICTHIEHILHVFICIGPAQSLRVGTMSLST